MQNLNQNRSRPFTRLLVVLTLLVAAVCTCCVLITPVVIDRMTVPTTPVPTQSMNSIVLTEVSWAPWP
jgi:hypothetical protein